MSCAGCEGRLSDGFSETTALQVPAAVEHQTNGLGINLVFLDEDPGRQRVHRIVVQDRDWQTLPPLALMGLNVLFQRYAPTA